MNDYERIARVIRYLDEHQRAQPSLEEAASVVGLSRHHFHRLFSRWAGITPKDFLQCLTLSHAKAQLRNGSSVLDAALEAGLSGPGRLHDLCVNLESASPGELKSGGSGWTIEAGFGDSPFGTCLIGTSPRGVCHLSFVQTKDRQTEAADLRSQWPEARIAWSAEAERMTAAIFDSPACEPRTVSQLRLFVCGTAFQVRVWRALLKIPAGTLTSYGRLAQALGHRGAARAVGSAVGKNPLAYLIPCHRVIRETGVVGEYRWGTPRKKAMLAWEASRRPIADHLCE